jgi:prevent-host-death family protein
MSSLTLEDARARLAEICASVAHSGDPVVICQDGQPIATLMPPDIQIADEETTRRILGSSENEQRLRAAVADAGKDEDVVISSMDELCRSVGIEAGSL